MKGCSESPSVHFFTNESDIIKYCGLQLSFSLHFPGGKGKAAKKGI